MPIRMHHKGEIMAKTKAELLEEAKSLKLDVTAKNTVKEINEAIKNAATDESVDEKPKKVEEKPAVAKAGKRSAKAIREQAEIEAKEARKETDESEEDKKPKQTQNPTRTRLERRSKTYKQVAEHIDKNEQYSLTSAIDLALKTSTTKFDSTVELHARLNVDPKQADQNIRDSVVMPAGTGKTLRVAVFAEDEDVAAAKKAGADIAGNDTFITKLEKNELDFDVLISTPAMMPKLGKHARVLGPKGLMPNPKSGTVTTDVAKAVNDAKGGKIEFRVDEAGIIHVPVGKVSFGKDKLQQNLSEIFKSIKSNKPASIKGAFVKSLYLTTSMGPSIQVKPSELA